MPKYTVHLLKSVMAWEGVEASDEAAAIKQCQDSMESRILEDGETPVQYVAVEDSDSGEEEREPKLPHGC